MNKLLIFISVLALRGLVLAQSITAEPASFYGLGEMSAKGHGVFDALGKNCINVFDSTLVNTYNPASYNRLSKGSTLYSVTLQSRQSWYSNGAQTQFYATPMVEQFTLGFKIKRNMGMAFGLRPFSSRGYHISEKVFTGLDSIQYNYTGKGAIQDLFLGYSFGILERKNTKWAVGANASYLFGSLYNERKSQLLHGASAAGGIERNALVMKSFYTEFGTYFQQQLGKNQNLRLAAVYQPNLGLSAAYSHELFSSATIGTPSTYDTLVNTAAQLHARMQSSLQLGLAYTQFLPTYKRQTRELHPVLKFYGSYSQYGALTQDSALVFAFNQSAYSRISVGVQFQSERNVLENIATLKGFEKLSYRLGYYQQTLPYMSNGHQYAEQGITFGFGLPLLAQQSLSNINFGFTFGKRSVDQINWSENFIGFRASLIMAPSNFDKWFRKRQLD
ncbi:MAG: hypothetical protein RLZZ301_617 [Bacteroidota bacterium]|jgi:hypothetical protein